jgi:hypothetical protein
MDYIPLYTRDLNICRLWYTLWSNKGGFWDPCHVDAKGLVSHAIVIVLGYHIHNLT